MSERFYTYVGLNEARQAVALTIDLAVVVAIHLLPEVVYIEADCSLNWTIRREACDYPELVERWQRARAAC